MVLETIDTVRDLSRLYQLAAILVRHGFGDIARRTGIARVLERAGRTLHWRAADPGATLSAPQRVRIAFEEMGPTFVKLGQILSTRVDLFEPDWIAEFERLQDHAAAVPFEAIRGQLAQDLGADPESVFAQVDRSPLAAGSIAQVHRARLHDGTGVILKIRRPGIEAIIDADLVSFTPTLTLATSSITGWHSSILAWSGA